MRIRFAWLSAVVAVVAVASVAVPAIAQPQASQLTEDQKVGAREDIARKKGQLEEYRKGKMSMRDGYQLMRSMLTNYALIGEAASPEAQKIQKEADDLEARYPKVVHEKPEEPEYVPPKRKPLMPKDVHIMGTWGSDHKIAVAYQYRIEFFHLPDDVFFSDSHGHAIFTRRSGGSETKADFTTLGLHPTRTMTFKRHVEIRPGKRIVDSGRLLVCTNLLWGYTPMTDDERASLPPDGLPYVRWESATGSYADFCGIVSLDGNVLWKLDFKQSLPNNLLAPVDILPDGSKALIFLGSQAQGQEGAEYVADPRELFVWEYPDHLKKLPGTGHGRTANELFGEFRLGKIK